jgi:CDP-diglyceride synthetase
MKDVQSEESSPKPANLLSDRARWIIIASMLGIMGIELAFILYNQRWFAAFLVTAIMLATASPIILGRRFNVYIPPEFQVLTVAFVFASLFLGEVRDFYQRIWWWDMALHATSGLLLGIFGFLLVYVLNENARVELSMKPRFVALFAFLFAVAVGSLWEVFEFAMDQVFGMQMQKPMLNDPSGLTDTMWDLIVDTLGAAIISALGWWYMSTGKESWLEIAIQSFIQKNPRFFRSGLKRMSRR